MAALKKRYAEIEKTEELDDGTLRVWGIASSAAEDSDGETITPEAMKAAIPDYMKWGAVREMHQPKAAGTALEAEVQDDGTTKFCAHVVDSEAVKKVKTGVYKGFSIGGNVTARDDLKKTVITGLKLIEVSLVDRPANPEAVITMYKAETPEPKQIWACDCNEHQHLTKAEASKCLAGELDKPAVDVSALIEKSLAAKDAPAAVPADAAEVIEKGMWSVSDFAQMLNSISWMVRDAASEAEWEGDSSPLPAQLSAWLKTGTEIFQAMAAEEIAEMLASLPAAPVEVEVVEMAEQSGELQKAGARNSKSDLEKIQSMHDNAVALGADCGSADKAHTEIDLAKMDAGALEKSDQTALEPFANAWFAKFAKGCGVDEPVTLEKYIADVNDELSARRQRIEELEAMPAATKGVLRVVGKGDDAGELGGREKQVEPVLKADGSVDDTATAIKKARMNPTTLYQ